MDSITLKLNTGGLELKKFKGRDYYVVDVNLLVPGVLNGSQGPLLYTPEETEKSAPAWNGKPIVLEHPVNQDGQEVSALDPEVLDKVQLGFLASTTFNGKLGAKAWFDSEETKRLSPVLHSKLKSRQPIEVSTGLFTKHEPVQGVLNNVQYVAIAKDYMPDHLAVLMSARGACSNLDGCGINVNSEKGFIAKFIQALKSVFTNNEETPVAGPNIDELMAAGEALISSPGAMPGYGQIYLKDGTGEVWYVGGDGDTPDFAQTVKDQLMSVAGVTAVLYEAETLPPESEGWSQVFTPTGEPPMAKLDANQRKAAVAFLTTNCACWKGKEKILNALTDDELIEFKTDAEKSKQAKAVANAAKAGFFGGKAVRNAEDPEQGIEDVEALLDWLKSAPPDIQASVIKKIKEAMMGAAPAAVMDAPADAPPPVGNANTDAEWLKAAPPGIRAVVQNAMAVEQSERESLCERLTANLTSAEERTSAKAALMQKPIPELKGLLKLMGTQHVAPTHNFFGPDNSSVIAPTVNADEDILPLPSLAG